MDDNQVAMIPYFLHEGDMARQERTIKRLWISTLILTFLFVGAVIFLVYRETQYEDVVTTTQTVTQDIDTGNGTAIVNDGVHVNGEGEADSDYNYHEKAR